MMGRSADVKKLMELFNFLAKLNVHQEEFVGMHLVNGVYEIRRKRHGN